MVFSSRSTQSIVTVSLLTLLASCGGSSSDSDNPGIGSGPSPSPSGPAVGSVIVSEDAPRVQLMGEKVVVLSVDEPFVDQGASAIDLQDGDISDAIVIQGQVDSSRVGDYIVRYISTDSDGEPGQALRFVRVTGTDPTRSTQRTREDSGANLGYVEHLPLDYGQGLSPLIIFHHGSGSTATGNLNDAECCGLPRVIAIENWDDNLPFVVLSPQRELQLNTPPIEEFVQFALANYSVDPSRVYMTGWSAGANVTMSYVADYPGRVAAMLPLAGGFFNGTPGNICDSAQTPMWMFLGDRDSAGINSTGLRSFNDYNECEPSVGPLLTRFIEADHFQASNWPFITDEEYSVRSANDPIDQTVFDWFLSHRL